MAIEKQLVGRIIHKHDIEENWNKATGFIPKQGEIIVYDIDENYNYERFKIGDGNTSVINLPFQKTNINDLKAVSYDIAQKLTDDQKAQARTNIGAISIDDIPTPDVQPNAIIDVTELPTENINKNSWYRLLTGKFVFNQWEDEAFTTRCVNELPEVGDPVTTDMSDVLAYYSISDNDVYGYINDTLAASAGVPAGWYTLAMLAPIFDVSWSGVITDIDDDPCDDSFRLLLKYDFYMFQDGWCKVPFAYEKAPEFDIPWDGVIGDRFALDVSSLGFANTYFVKVSDEVFTVKQLVGARYTQSSGYECDISEDVIDTTTYPGAMSVDNGVVIVHTSDDLNAALGLPAGYVTNGVYFVYVVDTTFTNRLVAPPKITKIDSKYLDTSSGVGKNVAGQEFVVDGTSVVANEGSEIFNDYAHNTSTGGYSHAEGHYSHANGAYSHAEGCYTHANGSSSHAEGHYSHANGSSSHAEGVDSYANGGSSHAEGCYTHANGSSSHAEGWGSYATGAYSHAEGNSSHANGGSSHAEGCYTHAGGSNSHAEGLGYVDNLYIVGAANSKTYCVYEQYNKYGTSNKLKDLTNIVIGSYVCEREHYKTAKIISVDVNNNEITLDKTLSENTKLEGSFAYVYTSGMALGNNSHSEGNQTIAAGRSQHTQGEFNIVDPEYDVNDNDKRGKYAHIVGNGSDHLNRSNAHTLDWSGNAWYQGSVYVGGTSQDDTVAEKLVTESEVDTKLASLVNSAPEKLNTLDELAAALGDDENFANTVTTELSKKVNSSDLASWAKEPTKPTYTASEVGALPNATVIPDALADLTDDSTHRTVTDAEKATWNAKSNFSGNYNDLTNKPTIPSAYTHPTSHPASMITGLATVATSGSYNDLTNKPTIPAAVTVDSALSSTSTNPVQNKVINTALAGKSDTGHNHSASEITSGTLSATRGGTGVTSISALATALSSYISGGAKIQTGKYTGNGSYGKTKSCSLTFNFTPKLVAIFEGSAITADTRSASPLLMVSGGTNTTNIAYSGSAVKTKTIAYTISGSTITWYADNGTSSGTSSGANDNTAFQHNNPNTIYNWIAIG